MHKRGAPKISSKQGDFNNAKVGDKYTDYIDGLKSGIKKDKSDRLTDPQIAQALLEGNPKAFKTQEQLRAAAMMDGSVNVAEEWRKTGAAKIFRGQLRYIKDGKGELNNLPSTFKFIKSAKHGRKQIGRIYNYRQKIIKQDQLPEDEQKWVGYLSPDNEMDYSTDEEGRKAREIKGKRLFAAKHNKGKLC